MKYLEILKKTKAYNDIDKDFSSGNVSHAYLIKSDDSELMLEFALHIACKILCDNKACYSCRICNNIINNVHADLLIYPKGSDKINVAQVGEIIESCYKKGMESENKVYILKNASKMLASSQNKLLKILEEPPRGVHFILLSDTSDNILTTIKSRTRQVELEKTSPNDIRNYLLKNYSDKNIEPVVISCDGVLTRAIAMIEDDTYMKMYDDMFLLLENFDKSTKLLEKSTILSKYDKKLPDAFFLLIYVMRDALMFKNNKELIKCKDKLPQLQAISNLYPSSALIYGIEIVNEAFEKLVFNCNKTQLIDNVLLKILEVRAKCLI